MTIVIIGGGAVGLLVAGWLAQSAQPIALLARPRVAAALASNPLHIDYRGETRTVHIPVVASDVSALPAAYQRPDLAILCVKSYDTPTTLPALRHLQPAHVLTLQNGLGNEEFLAEHLGALCVLAGVITSSIDIVLPDHITVTKAGGIGLASLQNTQADLARLHSVLRTAGFTVVDYADYRALKWSKVLLNMLGNATAAILDMPIAAIYADTRLIALERRAFLEALAVMQHRRIRPVNLPGYPTALLAVLMHRLPAQLLFPLLRRAIAGGRGGKTPSLQRDLQQGRPHSEAANLYGAIAEHARETGLPAPVNTILWSIVNDILAGQVAWDTFRSRPDHLLEIVEKTQTPYFATGKESHV